MKKKHFKILSLVVLTLTLFVFTLTISLNKVQAQAGSSSPYYNGHPGDITLSNCTITNFMAGKMQDDGSGVPYVYEETGVIPYIPGTFFGVSFDYESNTGGPVEYLEIEYFPAAPTNWTMMEGVDASYKVFRDELVAEFRATLTPDFTTYSSYWGFNNTGDPLGDWIWDIYFDDEYFTTVIFTVVSP